MEAERRKTRVRKPLSDCTNTVAGGGGGSRSSSAASLLHKPRKSILSSAIKKLLTNADTNSDDGTAKSTAQNDDASSENVSRLPPPVHSTPSRPPRSSSASGRGDCEGLEPCSVYGRRQTAEKRKSQMPSSEEPLSNAMSAEKWKSKGKEIAEPLSCPPATKIHKIGEKKKEDGGNSPSKALTVPHKKKQDRPSSGKNASRHTLPQDFIEQQRAYFAEIDAFELAEEEIHSSADWE